MALCVVTGSPKSVAMLKDHTAVSQELLNPVLKMVFDGPPSFPWPLKYVCGSALFTEKLFHVANMILKLCLKRPK
jgi:hypothetical protein